MGIDPEKKVNAFLEFSTAVFGMLFLWSISDAVDVHRYLGGDRGKTVSRLRGRVSLASPPTATNRSQR